MKSTTRYLFISTVLLIRYQQWFLLLLMQYQQWLLLLLILYQQWLLLLLILYQQWLLVMLIQYQQWLVAAYPVSAVTLAAAYPVSAVTLAAAYPVSAATCYFSSISSYLLLLLQYLQSILRPAILKQQHIFLLPALMMHQHCTPPWGNALFVSTNPPSPVPCCHTYITGYYVCVIVTVSHICIYMSTHGLLFSQT